jgi:hypothetical protein
MYQGFRAVVLATLTTVALSTGGAEAGASASAASKYTQARSAEHKTSTSRQALRQNYIINEYSSSSARGQRR